jgi:cell division protein FtsI/penicillin-binding protein 2
MIRAIVLVLILSLVPLSAFGKHKVHQDRHSKVKVKHGKKSKHKTRQGWYKEPSFSDSTLGDQVDGEELDVRRAAVEALGPLNGTVVVTDPDTGRILTVVNQKLAFRSGFTPCSTIKLVTALAALNEGLIERKTTLRVSRRLSLDLDGALAHSNLSNGYFGKLGQRLGFERVARYAQMLGIGEKAGWNIDEEQAGVLPDSATSGLKYLTSCGTGISLTPLELASMVGALANGGTMYYLQYPRTQDEIDAFAPRVKRQLDFTPSIEEVKLGMRAAVDYGTGQRANYNPVEPVFGKTGTCSDFRYSSHLGWFGSFNEAGDRRLVVVVLLTGGKMMNGPLAAEVAGKVYQELSTEHYFTGAPVAQVSTGSCCSQ